MRVLLVVWRNCCKPKSIAPVCPPCDNRTEVPVRQCGLNLQSFQHLKTWFQLLEMLVKRERKGLSSRQPLAAQRRENVSAFQRAALWVSLHQHCSPVPPALTFCKPTGASSVLPAPGRMLLCRGLPSQSRPDLVRRDHCWWPLRDLTHVTKDVSSKTADRSRDISAWRSV